MVALPWRSSRLSCGERLLLRCDRNAGKSFPTKHDVDDITLMGENIEVLKSFLMRAKEESERASLKLNIHKRTNIFVLKMCIGKQRHYSADKGPYSQGCGLPSDHVRLWELDHKEDRAPMNLCL